MTELEKLEDAVDWFAEKMKAKLRKKALEGFDGWDESSFATTDLDPRGDHTRTAAGAILEHLITMWKCADTSQAVDIANFAMFIAYAEAVLRGEISKR